VWGGGGGRPLHGVEDKARDGGEGGAVGRRDGGPGPLQQRGRHRVGRSRARGAPGVGLAGEEGGVGREEGGWRGRREKAVWRRASCPPAPAPAAPRPSRVAPARSHHSPRAGAGGGRPPRAARRRSRRRHRRAPRTAAAASHPHTLTSIPIHATLAALGARRLLGRARPHQPVRVGRRGLVLFDGGRRLDPQAAMGGGRGRVVVGHGGGSGGAAQRRGLPPQARRPPPHACPRTSRPHANTPRARDRAPTAARRQMP
jgi:hypothetical protein